MKTDSYSACISFNLSGPAYQAFPDYLKETNCQNETKGRHAFHKGFNTDLPAFVWLQQHPDKLKWFQLLMSVPREGDWLDVLPVPSLKPAEDGGDNQVVFVDVGGGFGHQCARLTDKYPEFKGHVVLQDRPEAIAVAPPIPGVQAMAHDFFTPQTVKGSCYRLRSLLPFCMSISTPWPVRHPTNIWLSFAPPQDPSSITSALFSMTGTTRTRRKSFEISCQP
jgi:hypothetical protein